MPKLDARGKDLVKIGDSLFGKRTGLVGLWQTIAENFYPERADFVSARSMGADYASGLMSSYPTMIRRELGNIFASFLRPRSPQWFALHCKDKELDQQRDARAWMEWATGVQWQAMYDPEAQFVRATKEGDHDFATFGQCVISVELGLYGDTLLHRCWHLRDCAWAENAAGQVDTMHRKWKSSIRALVQTFGKEAVDEKLVGLLAKEPEREVPCRHIVVPADMYDLGTPKSRAMPFVSLYVDEENESLLEAKPLGWFCYIVPRWQTVSGSQYARSPFTEVALADARLLQAVTLVLLEAGQKAVDPPMVAVQEALRSDVNLLAGGLTMVDIEYDERTGEALRSAQDLSKGLPFGFDIAKAIQQALKEGSFLNKLGLPEVQMKTMTAYEVRKIIEDHVRQSAPLFEPVEQEYNAPLCNLDFEILRTNGAFGSVEQMPEMLRGAEVEFVFASPLREVEEEIKSQQFSEGLALIGQAAQIDPAQIANVDMTTATRDALQGGLRWPAKWMNDPKAVEAKRAADAKAAQMQRGMATMAGAAQVAKDGGAAAKALAEAGVQ